MIAGFYCIFKTTYMLTFPWELTSCVADWVLYSSGVTSQLRCSVSFASQMFSLYQECFSTSKLAPNPSCSILPLPRLVGQALTRLVTVSSMHYCTSTSDLSTLSSSRGLTSFRYGISHLEGGFTLRCLQRLSLPDLATLPCTWRCNRYTSGPSIPVLSY